MRVFSMILTLVLLAGVAVAADVTGKWVAQQPGRNGTREVTYTLKADGDKLTGTTTGRGGDIQIADGKISGDTITFTTKTTMNDNTVVSKFTGKVAGDEIKFKMEREGGEPREFTAKRAN